MNSRADYLYMRIALYRSYLRESLPVEEADRYLRQIRADEAELRTLEKKPPPLPAGDGPSRLDFCAGRKSR